MVPPRLELAENLPVAAKSGMCSLRENIELMTQIIFLIMFHL